MLKRLSLIGGAALTMGLWIAHAAAPEGWFLAGSKPAFYETGTDPQNTNNGKSSAFLKAKPEADGGFGTLMQSFSAEQYRGKRVRFSAYVKSQDVKSWAGMWMRVDGPTPAGGGNPPVTAFDNMQNRAIKGTQLWRQYEVVLDVDAKAAGISFGILLDGPGEVWLNSASFEVVSSNTPLTGGALNSNQPSGPRNLELH
jgi:hypothetical protein